MIASTQRSINRNTDAARRCTDRSTVVPHTHHAASPFLFTLRTHSNCAQKDIFAPSSSVCKLERGPLTHSFIHSFMPLLYCCGRISHAITVSSKYQTVNVPTTGTYRAGSRGFSRCHDRLSPDPPIIETCSSPRSDNPSVVFRLVADCCFARPPGQPAYRIRPIQLASGDALRIRIAYRCVLYQVLSCQPNVRRKS
jgi:hypothetical protein